jgi:glyoxylase-like metal-dependent hydrolase (beta-lactamase superfamily II)
VSHGGPWRVDVIVPAHRIVLALDEDGTPVQLSAGGPVETFRAYRRLPDAVHGMIAWPNTLLLRGPATLVVDPGYQTQGDMLVAVLERAGVGVEDVDGVLMTHLHTDHLGAVRQLGEVPLWVHEAELDTEHARVQSGLLDRVRVHPMRGDEGEAAHGIRWIHTPGHAPGHVAYVLDSDRGRVVVAGDTLGPDPRWFAEDDPPPGLPEREAHLAAYRRIRAESPDVVIPGHYAPISMR